MFSKQLKDISYQDVYDLVYIQKESEGYNLDYKGEPKNIDEFANKLIKEFSAFANTYGGYLILGIDEKDKKNKEFEITGISNTINNKNVVEWINQTINGNIEPKIYYPDPKEIEIPKNDKIVLVYHIPESRRKPHFNSRDSKYYIRQNDISEPAKHFSIRDMFETTRKRFDDFNDFLAKRNLLDEEKPDFALNKTSKLIKTDVPEFKENQPLFLVSFVPKFPNQEIIRIHKNEFVYWLKNNSSGYKPLPNFQLFSTSSKDFNLHGLTFNGYNHRSYIEFQNNGFFETGLCESVFMTWKERQESFQLYSLHITYCVGYII